MSEASQLLYRPSDDLPDFMQEPPHGAEVRHGANGLKHYLPAFCSRVLSGHSVLDKLRALLKAGHRQAFFGV